MPRTTFTPGQTCACQAIVTNFETATLTGYPLFVLLEVSGTYFFAPSFSEFDKFDIDYPTGKSTVEVLPEFIWPSGAGHGWGIMWYGALTDSGITKLISNLGTFEFGWQE